jgi:hypothetical protein
MEDAIRHEEERGEEINEEIIVEHNEGIIDGEDDEDEGDGDDEEEMRERRERRENREEVIREVANNDPSCSTLWIGTDEDEFDAIMPNDGDWKGFGESLGRNTHINELAFSLNTSQMGVQLVHFFRGFAMNRCIEKLILDDITSQSNEMFLLLVPFFSAQ